MLLLREDDVRSLLTMEDTVACVERATLRHARGGARLRPRDRLRVPSGTLNVLTAADLDAGVAGLKAYIAVAGAGPRFFVVLFDLADGSLLTMMEADLLGMRRTGAASGVATRHLAVGGRTHTLAIIGAGWQARGQLEAVLSVCDVDEVRVFSATAERREQFARWVGAEHGVPCRATASAGEACAGASVVCTATNAAQPVLDLADVEPGTHINAAGANSLVRRELTDELVAAATVVVDSRRQAELECGDLLAALQKGRVELDQVPELGEVLAGLRPGRVSDDEITIFESQGLGLHDVAVAHHVLERARAAGRGDDVPFAGTLSKELG